MIQIELRPELRAQIAAAAQARGLALEQYIVETLEATNGSQASERHSAGETMKNIRSRSRKDSAQRHDAVDAMIRFAGQHGFVNESEDFKAAAHQGHKY